MWFPKVLIGGGRAPRGARGLKCFDIGNVEFRCSRAPRGARGLKFPGGLFNWVNKHVVPLAGHVD